MERVNPPPGLWFTAEEREVILLDDASYVDAYVGHRVWRAEQHRGEVRLISITWDAEYAPRGTMRASCVYAHPHATSPHEPCNCGVYAYRSEWILRCAARQMVNRRGFLLGQVQLWGKIIVGKSGYRAELARVSAVYDVGNPVIARVAALQYDVPLLALSRDAES